MRRANILPIPSTRSGQARFLKIRTSFVLSKRVGNILPIALIAFAIVAFIFMVDYSISGGKWPWSVNNTNNTSGAITGNTNSINTNDGDFIVCPQDVKLCPDGSYVARSGPKCEFSACPGTNTNNVTSRNTNIATDATAGWKTYTSVPLGFTALYPPDWIVSECDNIYVAFDAKKHGCATEYGSGFNVKTISPGDITTQADTTKNQWTNVHDEQITIGGYPARRITGTGDLFGDHGWYQDMVYITIGSRALLFHYLEKPSNAPPNLQNFISFLSKLSFTSPTADWKTYTNSTFGFAFQYPNNLTFKSTTNTWTVGSIDTQAYMLYARVLDRSLDPNNLTASYSLSDTNGVPVKVTDAIKVSVGIQDGYRYREGDGGCSGTAIQTALKNYKTLLVCLPAPQATPSLNYWHSDLATQAILLSTFTFTK